LRVWVARQNFIRNSDFIFVEETRWRSSERKL
jgi:hypothetical protein